MAVLMLIDLSLILMLSLPVLWAVMRLSFLFKIKWRRLTVIKQEKKMVEINQYLYYAKRLTSWIIILSLIYIVLPNISLACNNFSLFNKISNLELASEYWRTSYHALLSYSVNTLAVRLSLYTSFFIIIYVVVRVIEGVKKALPFDGVMSLGYRTIVVQFHKKMITCIIAMFLFWLLSNIATCITNDRVMVMTKIQHKLNSITPVIKPKVKVKKGWFNGIFY